MKKPCYKILHTDGGEMCTVVFRVESAKDIGDGYEDKPVDIPVRVRWDETLESDIKSRYSEWLELAIESFRKEAQMTQEEIIAMLVETTERAKSNTKRINKIEGDHEKTNDSINRMAIAVEKLANEQIHQVDLQKRLVEKIEAIEKQPAQDVREIRKKILEGTAMLIIGAILGAIFALIFK